MDDSYIKGSLQPVGLTKTQQDLTYQASSNQLNYKGSEQDGIHRPTVTESNDQQWQSHEAMAKYRSTMTLTISFWHT